MSWKHLTALAVFLGAGLGASAQAGDIRAVLPGVPARAVSPALAPPGLPDPAAHGCHPIAPRDLERHIERAIRRHYGSCVCEVEVDVSPRRRHVEVDLEVHRPIPRRDVMRLLYALPELRGYEVRLDIDRD